MPGGPLWQGSCTERCHFGPFLQHSLQPRFLFEQFTSCPFWWRVATCRIDFGDQNLDFSCFLPFRDLPRPFDLSTEGVALSHQGACIREVRNFCHWASCRDPNLLNWDLGRTSPWPPMESTDPLNSGGCDSSRLGSPNGRSCKLPSLTIIFLSMCDTEQRSLANSMPAQMK